MAKFTRMRDGRINGGPRLSMCIAAGSAEEANELFEERWRQKLGEARNAERETRNAMPVRTTRAIQATAMTPAALRVKRETKGMK